MLVLIILFIMAVTTYKIAIAEPNINCDDAIDEKACTNDYKDYLNLYDWDTEIAYAVMMAESRADADAYNGERHRTCNGSVGLFQIACIHDDTEKLLDAKYNIAKAYEIYSKSGWKPWGAYTDKRYLQYL